MKDTYCIEAGNSSEGAIGFVFYVEASSAEEALMLAQDGLPFDDPLTGDYIPGYGGLLGVYFNPDAITIENVSLAD